MTKLENLAAMLHYKIYHGDRVMGPLNSRDLYPVLGEITLVRYEFSVQVKHADTLIRCTSK